MWKVFAKWDSWIEVASGYTLPTQASKAIDNLRKEYPDAAAFMIGIEIWIKPE